MAKGLRAARRRAEPVPTGVCAPQPKSVALAGTAMFRFQRHDEQYGTDYEHDPCGADAVPAAPVSASPPATRVMMRKRNGQSIILWSVERVAKRVASTLRARRKAGGAVAGPVHVLRAAVRLFGGAF